MSRPSHPEPSPQLRALGRVVERVGPLARDLWRELARVPPIVKSDGSPVTVVDCVIQAVLVYRLRGIGSDVGFVCEESSATLLGGAPSSALELFLQEVRRECGAMSDAAALALLDAPAPTGRDWWLVDPIDGTAGFIAGSHFSVCVARVSDGEVRMSAVGCPRLLATLHAMPIHNGPGSTVLAERGKGTWALDEHGSELQMRRAAWQAPLRWARSMNRKQLPVRAQPVVDGLGVSVESIPVDSQCKYALLAMDRADLVLRLPRAGQPEHAWDHVAGALAAEESGSVVTDICGKPLDASHGARMLTNQGILCAPPELHSRLVQLLAPFVGAVSA